MELAPARRACSKCKDGVSVAVEGSDLCVKCLFLVGARVESASGKVRHRGLVTFTDTHEVEITHDSDCPLCDHLKGYVRTSSVDREGIYLLWRVTKPGPPPRQRTFWDKILEDDD
jgi:hypothetical protein